MSTIITPRRALWRTDGRTDGTYRAPKRTDGRPCRRDSSSAQTYAQTELVPKSPDNLVFVKIIMQQMLVICSRYIYVTSLRLIAEFVYYIHFTAMF